MQQPMVAAILLTTNRPTMRTNSTSKSHRNRNAMHQMPIINRQLQRIVKQTMAMDRVVINRRADDLVRARARQLAKMWQPPAPPRQP